VETPKAAETGEPTAVPLDDPGQTES
jgi:hypothetical protein